VEARHAELTNRIAQVETLTQKKDDLSRRLSVLKEILVRARGGRVLESVGASCPASTLLTKVDVRLNSTGPVPVIDLTIEGRCPDDESVANLLDALQSKPLLSEVQLVLSENLDAVRSEKKFVVTAQSPGQLSLELLEERP
jgi:Tfp pilus assembly protein PilN